MSDVVQAPENEIRLTRGGVVIFTASSLIGAGLGAALMAKRPALGAVIGAFAGGLVVPGLLVAIMLPLARAKVGAA